jgi:integrase
MILVGYRHGLRVSELVDLRWDQVDFRTATLHVRRVKQGTPSSHPILGDELRRCGGWGESKSRSRHLYLRRSVRHHLPRQDSLGWSSGR